MSAIVPLLKGKDPVGARLKKTDLQTRQLEPTPENRKMLKTYEELARRINEIPQRIAGLRINYRRRELPMHIARLTLEREELMKHLIELEKVLFPPKE